jgi:hypothetical protein
MLTCHHARPDNGGMERPANGERERRARRAGQLRRAKRAQRARERALGLALVQLRLPAASAARLRVAARLPGFAEALEKLLDEQLVAVADFPLLKQLLWTGRPRALVPAEEAFRIYERNWRFVRRSAPGEAERSLIGRLARRYGRGLVNG